MTDAESLEGCPRVRVRVPGKINLALCVGGLRPDGYHELATIFQAVSIFDEVTAYAVGDGISCEMIGEQTHKIGPERYNLAYRAAHLLRCEFGITEGVHLRVDKRIPIAGGMAGGSADAAGSLLACSRLWGLGLTSAELSVLAERLGADVPFALMGGCAVGLGRGEKLTPTLCRGVFHWVLAFAGRELSTPEVFRRFDQLADSAQSETGIVYAAAPTYDSAVMYPPTPGFLSSPVFAPGSPFDADPIFPTGPKVPTPTIPRSLMMALASGDIFQAARGLVNDLTTASCSMAPELRATLDAGREAGCLGAVISGSGPTVAFVAEDEVAATDLAVRLSSAGVAAQVRKVIGPVPGATVVPD